MVRHPSLVLLAAALAPTFVACAIDPGSGSDQGSEPAAQTSEAVGGTVQNLCGPNYWTQLQFRSIEADPDGHVQVRLCVPSQGDFFRIDDQAVGGWDTPYDNKSGQLDLYNVGGGFYHQFTAAHCYNSGYCWGATPPALVYNPFPDTNWVDTDSWSGWGTAPYDNGFPTGIETLSDGTRRNIFSCAVVFNGTTQVGKASAAAPGGCWFGYGGREQFVTGGMVLEGTSRQFVFQQWLPAANFMGVHPVQAGMEPNNNEYICHAPFVNPITHLTDTVPGKTVGSTCNISWGGREYPIDPSWNFVEILNEL